MRSEQTASNEQFRRWLESYADTAGRVQLDDALMSPQRGRLKVGRKLTRDEMNRH